MSDERIPVPGHPNLKMWPKGVSGNPGGKTKLEFAFRKRCRQAVDEHCVEKWIAEVKEQGEHWVRCSELLAAYGYGKPKDVPAEATEEATEVPTPEAAAAAAERLRALRESLD